MRSRAPPVADAARRSTRSGRKERASEQREVLFGYRKAEGADAPAATFGAHLCWLRICFSRLFREKQYSYPAQLSVKGVCQGGSPVPLDRVLPTFARTKVGPRRVGVLALHPTKSPRRRRRLPIWLKNTFAPFLHRKGGPRRRAVQAVTLR